MQSKRIIRRFCGWNNVKPLPLHMSEMFFRTTPGGRKELCLGMLLGDALILMLPSFFYLFFFLLSFFFLAQYLQPPWDKAWAWRHPRLGDNHFIVIKYSRLLNVYPANVRFVKKSQPGRFSGFFFCSSLPPCNWEDRFLVHLIHFYHCPAF